MEKLVNPAGLSNLTLKESLRQQKQRMEAELARVTELVALFEAHPEVERILDLLAAAAVLR